MVNHNMKTMKKTIFTLSFLLLAGVALSQNSLTKEEKGRALAHLKATQSELKAVLKGLSASQLNYRPDSESWSIAECVEHIAITETNIFAIVEMTLKGPTDPSLRGEVKMSDQQVLSIIESREQKVKTRPEAEPSQKFGGAAESYKAFLAKRKSNMKFVKTTDQDLRNRYFDFPFGKVDAYQVILFMSGHTRRHVSQIEEIIASAGYPTM